MRFLSFLATFVVLFGFSVAFLAMVDSLPEPDGTPTASNGAGPLDEMTHPDVVEMPVRIEARDVGVYATVANPDSTDIEVLDAALLNGAVRYPASARLGEDGTVLIFGHSSHLPIVRNQAYKAFNEIQDLEEGQVVSVYSESAEYRYRVVGVRLAKATEDVIELPAEGKHLVLVTCNSFGTKSDRWVVTADFAGSYPVRQ